LISAFGLIGLLIASRGFIIFMNKLNPLQGLLIWYMLIGFALLLLFHGHSISISGVGTRGLGFLEVIASLAIIWAFQIIISVESPWAAEASNLDPNQVPQILFQSEDGVTYYIFYQAFKFLENSFPFLAWKTYPDFIAFMTYVVAPILLLLFAAAILSAKKFTTTIQNATRI